MLSLLVFLPLVAAIVLVAVPRIGDAAARWLWLGVAAVEVVLVGVATTGHVEGIVDLGVVVGDPADDRIGVEAGQ